MHLTSKPYPLKSIFSFVLTLSFFCTLPQIVTAQEGQEFYQLKVYHLKDSDQKKRLEHYLEHAYLPALHRAGINMVGVFYPSSSGEETENGNNDSLLYVLIPFSSLNQFVAIDDLILKDSEYKETAKNYLEAAFDKPPYARYESILMEAFSGMPTLQAPNLMGEKSGRIYELRSYEAATEMLHLNKVKMFNDGEIEIFKRLGFNAIFYARVLAGSKLPNLMYMTSFENMDSREAHWKAFGEDPGWVNLSADPQYENNFLKADIYLLHSTTYSDI